MVASHKRLEEKSKIQMMWSYQENGYKLACTEVGSIDLPECRKLVKDQIRIGMN